MKPQLIRRHNGMVLIPSALSLEVMGRYVRLTYSDAKILDLFFKLPERVITREQISRLFESGSYQNKKKYPGNSLHVTIKIRRLRRKMFPNKPKLANAVIKTCYGEGYKLVDMKLLREHEFESLSQSLEKADA